MGCPPIRGPTGRVKILQGEEVRQHLTELEAAWAVEGSLEWSPGASVADGIAEYFAQRPAGDATLTCEIGPSTPLLVTAEIGTADDLRGVMCLQVLNLEDGTKTISDPQFLTGVEDTVIISDLLPAMLSEQALSLLQALDAAEGNQQALIGSSVADAQEMESRLVAASNELGTSDPEEAAMLLSAISG